MKNWLDDDLYAAVNRAASAGNATEEEIRERFGIMLGGAEPRIYAAVIETYSGTFDFPPDWGNLAGICKVQDRVGETVDLVAWHHDRPSKWWMYVGNAVMLGERYLFQCEIAGIGAYVVETPWDWLKASGQAVCVLDWNDFDPLRAYNAIPTVNCATEALKQRMREATFARVRPGFQITAVREGAHAA